MSFTTQFPQPPQQAESKFATGLGAGLAHGLESSVTKYFDQKQKTEDYEGAGAILDRLPKDYALEDVLKAGRDLKAKPGAMQVALDTAKKSHETRSKVAQQQSLIDHRKAQEDAALKRITISDPLYKDAVAEYTGIRKTAKDVKGVKNASKHIRNEIAKGHGSSGKLGTVAKNMIPHGSPFRNVFERHEHAGAKAIDVYGKAYVDTFKQTFGQIRPSILTFIENVIPNSKYRDDQNLAILDAHDSLMEVATVRATAAEEIFREGGYVPTDFSIRLDDKVAELEELAEIKMQKAYRALESSSPGGPAQQSSLEKAQSQPPPAPSKTFDASWVNFTTAAGKPARIRKSMWSDYKKAHPGAKEQ